MHLPRCYIVCRLQRKTSLEKVASGVSEKCLGLCRTAKAPYGYVLPAFAWYVDQTVGGAVSTGTHGSTMFWGSLSSQVCIYLSFKKLSILSKEERIVSFQPSVALWLRCLTSSLTKLPGLNSIIHACLLELLHVRI